MKLFILTNHTATEQQLEDAKRTFGVTEIVDLPADLKALWGSVPPEIDSVAEYVVPVLQWLESLLRLGDVVWVQGEWGATLTVIDWCRARSVRCVYSTTQRIAVERVLPGGGVALTHVFDHVRFRDFFK